MLDLLPRRVSKGISGKLTPPSAALPSGISALSLPTSTLSASESPPDLPEPGLLAAAPRFLLTSFRPWRAHQISNASDDLLAALQHQALLPKNTYLLRRLPVSFQLAPAEVLENIVLLRPDFVICCGLAENRCRLSLELQGVEAESFLQTPLYLPSLLSGTTITEISADAGSYVCNYLYFRVLQFLSQKPGCQALFVHVPPLNQANTPLIVQDFRRVLHQLAVLSSELLLSNS